MVRIGNEMKGMEYRKRSGAYVIIERKEDNKVAIATVDRDYFLLGGGIEEGETAIETIKREVIEEAGYTIKNIQYFDKLSSWTIGKKNKEKLENIVI